MGGPGCGVGRADIGKATGTRKVNCALLREFGEGFGEVLGRFWEGFGKVL